MNKQTPIVLAHIKTVHNILISIWSTLGILHALPTLYPISNQSCVAQLTVAQMVCRTRSYDRTPEKHAN